jgi:hypothetical protein
MRTTLNSRRMTAKEVRQLRDGALVTVRKDPRVREAKVKTICYRVSTKNGLKVLIEKGSGAMKTIKERPGRVYYREGGY